MYNNYKRVKLACYSTNISMSVASNISPLLFLTFHANYGISYSLLGLLVLINFLTQLTVDLLFSVFADKFNIPLIVKLTPIVTFTGLILYSLAPFLFPENIYIGLVLGTIIFSASGGLVEVLISPVIAAIPSDNPEREMSKLHSIYAWGVVFVVILASLFLTLAGNEYWYILSLIFSIVPLFASVLFARADIPLKSASEESKTVNSEKRTYKSLIVCFFAIFLGGASETIMSQWSSAYIEAALGIPKIWGDVFGVAIFALTLGLGRTLYAKFGTNIEKFLFFGAISASICYITATLTNAPILGLLACALTGLSVSMMWPGSLIISSNRIPNGGVFVFAMMAAGGDLGGSIGPQLVGAVTDIVISGPNTADISYKLGLTAEQFGMKCGMLTASVFPFAAIFVYLYLFKTRKKYNKNFTEHGNESNN